MFINKTKNGKNNICGSTVSKLRVEKGISQRALADGLQLIGLDIDKNAVQRIEAGKRFVTDIELRAIAYYFNISIDDLVMKSEEDIK